MFSARSKKMTSRARLLDYETKLRLGTKNWYAIHLGVLPAERAVHLFVGDPRYRLDVLKLLQGDVYDDAAPPVLEKMKKMVPRSSRIRSIHAQVAGRHDRGCVQAGQQ